MPLVWEFFQEKLARVSCQYGAEIHTFVLMSNHFHLLLTTPFSNVDEILRYLMTEVSRSVRYASGRLNHVFGSRYGWSILYDARAYASAYKYVLRNPVRAGLCESVQDYQYSSVLGLQGAALGFPWCDRADNLGRLVPRTTTSRLEWLNLPTRKEAEELIRRALHHREFVLPAHKDFARRRRELEESYQIEGLRTLIPRKGTDTFLGKAVDPGV